MSHDLHLNVEGGDAGAGGPGLHGSMEVASPSSMMDDVSSTTTTGNESIISAQLKKSAHPTILIFHILFKCIALILYILGDILAKFTGLQFIGITVLCILLLAADFWVVKNVTGRILVGLRWWNQVDGDTTRWIFESKGQEAEVNAFDRRMFWGVLYGTPVVWVVMFIMGIFRLEKLKWLLVVCMALTLSCANVYGYYKCSSDQKAKFTQMMQQGAQQGAMAAMRSGMFGMLMGAGGVSGGGSSNSSTAGTTTTYV